MEDLHRAGGLLALLLSVIAALWAGAALVVRRDPGRFFDANVVWVVLVVAATGALGIAIALRDRPPADALHIVYGLIAVGAWPAVLLVASGRSDRARGIARLAGAIVVLILVVRLIGTGG